MIIWLNLPWDCCIYVSMTVGIDLTIPDLPRSYDTRSHMDGSLNEDIRLDFNYYNKLHMETGVQVLWVFYTTMVVCSVTTMVVCSVTSISLFSCPKEILWGWKRGWKKKVPNPWQHLRLDSADKSTRNVFNDVSKYICTISITSRTKCSFAKKRG